MSLMIITELLKNSPVHRERFSKSGWHWKNF